MVSRALLLAVLIPTSLPLCAQRIATEAEHGIVVSVQELASQAGADVLKQGGNAVDAAVATGFALAAVYPWAGNLGGGGFMLVHTADGRDVAIDFRETAPAAATREMYLDKDGNVLPRGPGSSTIGWRASGVPGTVAGLALTLEKYGSGKITWAQVLEPARRLAEGHTVTAYNATRARFVSKLLLQDPETKRIYAKDGAFWSAGELWHQPELAATLARLQKMGPREFYEGETAQKIASAMAEHGGTITAADLKNYTAVERKPLRGKYRGYEIVTMPPPSAGGIALLQIFQMMEPFDVAAMGPNSAAKYHLMIEAMRRTARVRSEYLGDPGFINVPVAGLLDPSYTAALMKDYDPAKATPSSAITPPRPAGLDTPGAAPASRLRTFYPLLAESTETTQFSAVDAAGNAVSATYTLNGGYGSGVTIPGTGVLMNNEMDDFTSKPGVPNAYKLIQGENNAIAPGRRPVSSMMPTIVLKDGHVQLITGSPGGSTIISTVLCVVTNFIDHQMPVAQAVDAPRIHHQWMPDIVNYEPYGLSGDTLDALRARGHTVNLRNLYGSGTGQETPLIELYQGDAESIAVDPKTHRLLGAPDSRKPDARAAGW